MFFDFLKKKKAERLAALDQIREKFAIFRPLLDYQNQVLKTISTLEEKLQSAAPLDTGFIRSSLEAIQDGTSNIIASMIQLGGKSYEPLKDRFQAIRAEIDTTISENKPIPEDDFVIPFDRLGRDRAFSVGGKNSNLGEMRSALKLPVPDGFAISAWGYKHFVTSNNLQERITKLLKGLKVEHYEELDVISDEIRAIIVRSPVPADLSEAIFRAFDELECRNPGGRFALRSSAVGEDTNVSFAGQYITFLNVRRDKLLDCYREIMASKFNTAAIYYYLHHTLFDTDLAMGVACMSQIDSQASGVLYTRDPVNPKGDYMLVNSIFGLGSLLVEGDITPDVFHVSRDNKSVIYRSVAHKSKRLTILPDCGVSEDTVPETSRDIASIGDALLSELTEYSLKIEEHYGTPQDIEWAVDKNGRLFFLQTRPLKVMQVAEAKPAPPELKSRLLFEGGTTIFPGAAGGPIFHVNSSADLAHVTAGAVVAAMHPSPNLIAVMHKISALMTQVGGTASHLATLAREAGLPTLVGVKDIEKLADGREVTVDATEGAVYDGIQSELIEMRRHENERTRDNTLEEYFRRIIHKVTHLNLINSNDPGFSHENCLTYHDISRFIHQRAMEEMFSAVKRTSHKDDIGVRLKTNIPLLVNIIHLDKYNPVGMGRRSITIEEIDSIPMRALWSGVQQEGWPQRPTPPDLKGFLAVVGTNISEGHQPEFSENSYAFVSKEYMLMNLRMGYHFATIEAILTPEPTKNYIRMQYKQGGAPLDRRMRRIRLICELLALMGFEHSGRGDFLDAVCAYQDEALLIHNLNLVGRINILTKQLDMALSTDEVARWYTDDFIKKLGLKPTGHEKGACIV